MSPPPVIITSEEDRPTPSTLSSSSPPRLALPISDVSPTTPPRIQTQQLDSNHLAASPMRNGGHSPSPSYSSLAPPSPTLTNTSVHFSEDHHSPASALALRGNNPTADDGMDTLKVVSEGHEPQTLGRHGRGLSVGTVGTWASDVPTETNKEKDGDLSRATTKHSWLPWKRNKDDSSDSDDEEKVEKSPQAEMAHLDPDKDTTDPTPFKENPSRLAMLVDPKSLNDLEKIGGTDGLLQGLGVDRTKGLLVGTNEAEAAEPTAVDRNQLAANRSGPQWTASMDKRREIYGRNDLPIRKSKSLLYLMWVAMKDKVLILLAVAAVVSLALGIYQVIDGPDHYIIDETDGCPAPGCLQPKVEWVEGVAICVAIAIVVLVGSVNDWQKERQFKKLNEKRDDRTVKVIRGGGEMVINVKDVVVGDVCLLEPGEIVPVDGVFLRGHNVRCDESGATGESDAVKKFTYEECIEERDNAEPGKVLKKDCFLISGAKVLEGVGEYVVISVGTKSFNGRIMMTMRGDTENTPLQLKLNKLAELIAKAGSGSGLILFSCLMIRFFTQLDDPGQTADSKAQDFISILIISVTLVVVAVPEGLPLAVTLALAFATKRMTKQNLLVRVLGSCETMANATVICTDKTGTLTQNVMTVVAGSLGVKGKFVRNLAENAARTNADSSDDREDFSLDMNEMNQIANPAVQNLFNDAICINSTAFEDKNEDGELEFVGSKTETALLRFAKDRGWADYKKSRESAEIVQMIPFSSELKAMGVVVKLSDKRYRLFVKGASEVLSKNCVDHIVVNAANGDSSTTLEGSSEIEKKRFDEVSYDNISKTIIFYANQSLRTIALCYRDFEQWPPRGAEDRAIDDVPFELIAKELSLIAITGIEDPLRDGVREAVEKCQGAGVAVKMCTGDNVLTARSIAYQCGIFTPGGLIMEGPVFRKLNEMERLEIVPRLQILARSSPEDKRLLVHTLKSMGEVVGVTGDGTNDGPALKLANVGFAMGIAGTEVAKEASDIILMDDAFSNIVLAIMWGRCVNDSVKKFLQFQISVNITAVVITFVSAVASASEESVLTAVQLLWVNLIMDTFAALALATDPARPVLLDRKPDRKGAPLITVEMFKMILVQAAYQIAVCLILHFVGLEILGLPHTPSNEADLRTLVFNCFVFCQIFNQLNCRRLDRKFNVLEGFFRNYYFMGIFAIMVAGQSLIVTYGGAAFTVSELRGRDWGISIIVGFMAIPLGALVRLMPTGPFERVLIKMHIYADPNKLPTVSPIVEDAENEKYEYNPALSKVKDNLHTYANIRGGRLRASTLVSGSRNKRLREADIRLPSLLTMIPTVVAGTVGAGGNWLNQLNPDGLSDPANQDPSRSTRDLFAGKVQLHPDSDPNDPLYERFGIEPTKKLEV